MEKVIIKSDRSHLLELPDKPGVYFFHNQPGDILYIGKARSLKKRLSSYFIGERSEKIDLLLSNATVISYILVNSEFDALILEANLVQKNQPKFNVELKDNKSYPFIKITKGDIPQVQVVRKILADQATYFGPYPDARAVHEIVKIFRKTFTFCTHRKPYRSCLYIHLGLCPFPFEGISKKAYLKNINSIKKILQGKRQFIESRLKKELQQSVKKENYEEASLLERQIQQLRLLTQQRIETDSYLSDPLVLDKKRDDELKSLVSLLNDNGVNIKRAQRIECFDISNIAGNQPTASMVVLTKGEPDKKEYKRFRIKYVRGINDYLMMKEVVKRRLNHKEWEKPDLMLIDGGFGQLKFAQEAIWEAGESFPVIGLAKRLEQICLPNSKLLTVNLQNPALHVLQRVRDEAHRFAKKYHTFLRLKHFKTLLTKK